MKKTVLNTLTASFLLSTATVAVPQVPQAEAATLTGTQVDALVKESAADRYNKAVANTTPVALDAATVNAFNSGKIISTKKLNVEMLKLINKERKANGSRALTYNTNTAIIKGTNTRANEVGTLFSHYRPNGTLFKTAFPASYANSVKGENVMRRSYSPNLYAVTSEKYLAEMMYQQWRKSPDHTANLLRPQFKKTALQVKLKYDTSKQKYYYYAVQIFTTK